LDDIKNKKKLDRRGKHRPHGFQLRRGQLTPAEKTPESRLPGLDWRHLGPGPVRNLHGPGRSHMGRVPSPKSRVAQPSSTEAQRGVFIFPQAG